MARVWGRVVLAVSTVGMFGAVLASSPSVAGASTPPTVTSVGVAYPYNDGRALPQVNINWGDYANAVTGVVFIGEGSAMTGSPSDLSPMIDYGGYLPLSPRSYQPAACPSGCSGTFDQLRSWPGIVVGPWWRPPVSSTISLPPPTVTAVRNGSPGIHVTVDPGGHTDAPVLAVVRDGHTVQLLTQQALSFTDVGPFGSTATYTAVACYSDCLPTMIDDGFAQETPQGPGVTLAAPAFEGPVPTCTPTTVEVGTSTTCTAYVRAAPGGPTPTGTLQFKFALPNAQPSATCTLDTNGTCAAAVFASFGFENSPEEIQVNYSRDANYVPYWNSTFVNITQRRSQTGVACGAATVNVGANLTCTVTVSDPDPGTATTPTGSVVISATGGSATPCTVTNGTCTITYQPSPGSDGPQSLTAAYQGDTDHQASQATAPLGVIPDPTTLVAAPLEAVASYPVFFATLTDNITGTPLGGQVVVFTAGGGTYCSAITDNTGTASCKPSDAAFAAAKASGAYQANFGGTVDYTPSTATGSLKPPSGSKTHTGS